MFLKEWLTVDDAAKYLSVILGEAVSSLDVIHFAMSGKLDVSIRFVNAVYAQRCDIVEEKDAELVEGIPVKGVPSYKVRLGHQSSYFPGRLIVPSGEVWIASGIYNFPLMPENLIELEAIFQEMIKGPDVDARGFDSVYFYDENGILHEIMDRVTEVCWAEDFYSVENFRPSIEGLPEDASIVFKSAALLKFQEMVANTYVVDKPSKDMATLGQRERTTLLNVIGALLELVKNPRDGRTSDAAVIRELLACYEDRPGISKPTLEAKFAEAKRSLDQL